MVNPYYDIKDIRVFGSTVNTEDLVWHRDKEDRIIEITAGSGWYFQFDNGIPFELKVNDRLHIPKMIYHRLYEKGKNNLVFKIRVV